MKKKTSIIIIIVLSLVLLLMCLGIYFLITHKNDIKKDEETKEESNSNSLANSLFYESTGDLNVYGKYLVEINESKIKVMDLHTTSIFEESFEGYKYVKSYYGKDDNVYFIVSKEYYNSTEILSEFILYKLDNKELKEINKFSCYLTYLFYNANDQVIAIGMDDNELLSFDGNYITINEGYLPHQYGSISFGEDLYAYNDSKIILEKGSYGNYSYALLDVDTKDILPLDCEFISAINDGNFRVKKDSKYGIIDDTGKYIVEAKYDFIDTAKKGLFILYENSKISLMNTDYKIVNKEPIDLGISNLKFYDYECCGNANPINAYYVGNKYIVDYVTDSRAEVNDDNNKIYIISLDGTVEVKDNIKLITYDNILNLIYISDYEGNDIYNAKVVKVLDENLEEVDINSIKEYNLNDIKIVVNQKNEAQVIKDDKVIDSFYWDSVNSYSNYYTPLNKLTDNYFIYYNSTKEKTMYYYYAE